MVPRSELLRVGWIVTWLKDQAWWIGPLAAITSIYTFYLTQLNPGQLELFLPDEIGVAINADRTLTVMLPMTIANTGAGRARRVVSSVTATLTDHGNSDPGRNEHPVHWTHDAIFLGKDQYFAKYPDKKATEDTSFEDYFDYDRRAVPFLIPGGASVSKVLGLRPRSSNTVSALNNVTLRVQVDTADGSSYEASAAYNCDGHSRSNGTHWCHP